MSGIGSGGSQPKYTVVPTFVDVDLSGVLERPGHQGDD